MLNIISWNLEVVNQLDRKESASRQALLAMNIYDIAYICAYFKVLDKRYLSQMWMYTA